MTTTKLSPDDAGCYIDGHWGQYGMARMVVMAAELGYDDAATIDVARRHLAAIWPSSAVSELTDDEYALLNDNDAEQWLNDHVAPEDYYFGWHDGEFFLQSVDWWNEDSQL